MGTLICMNCHNKQDGAINDAEEVCNRCGSKDMNCYHRTVKVYYRCQSCDMFFKISDTSAKQLLIQHKNPCCPKCSSKVTNPNLKKMYLKFSGQLKKHHIVQETNLGDFS